MVVMSCYVEVLQIFQIQEIRVETVAKSRLVEVSQLIVQVVKFYLQQ